MKSKVNGFKRLVLGVAIVTLSLSCGTVLALDHHSGFDCENCHDMTRGTTNDSLIFANINGFNVTFPSGGPAPFISDGFPTYDGICEVCHTTTKYHRNDSSGDHTHYSTQFCTDCHSHCAEFGVPLPEDTSHITHTAGPSRGPAPLDCDTCHVESLADAFDITAMVAAGVCDSCHSPGGVFDGVNHPAIGAKNNWLGGVYQEDGKTLKVGKEQWCAGCHDEDPGGIVIDDFEEYEDRAGLRANWVSRQDAREPQFETSGGPDGPQCMSITIDWDRNTKVTAGSIKRVFSPYIDLSGTDGISFYVKVKQKRRLKNIRIKLKKYEDGSVCVARVPKSSLANGAWTLVSVPRADFNDTTWGKVSAIQMIIREKDGPNEWLSKVYIDDIRASFSIQTLGPNVVGNNSSWGFYASGHGASPGVNCTTCHDSSSKHIDGLTAHIVDYVKKIDNPTNFRFYDSSAMGMQLPYNEYVRGPNGAFALCYTCHDESCITQNVPPEYVSTNFKDDQCYLFGAPANLHLYHVGVDQYPDTDTLPPEVFHGSCVLCHDPHGQSNAAMTRREMGNFIYFDANGCEITNRQNWDNPSINKGGAQTEGIFTYWPDLCRTCHVDAAPPDPNCGQPGHNRYEECGTGMNGYYKRTRGELCVGVPPGP